ncbi:MAG: nucleotidyltransferase domain-containing protein [Gammaproteobacteria bacterium]|nr:MAG: nucleotidyltransferase domain-containing protein [Gammaproteobacteria bacterium]
MIPEDIRAEIIKRIRNAEIEHNVKILYAVESGSRAWGFASPNSDYDVRFVYVRPKEWYLTIDVEDKRDVIEYPIVDEIDINGWDLRKALKLLWKSNPAIVEWLQSPIVYMDDGVFATTVRDLISKIYSVEKGVYHYRSMAKTNYRGYLKTELVPIKKYFYVLRPLLSIKWLEKFKQPAPIEFHRLRELINENNVLNAEIEALLERKKISQEKELAPPIKPLNDFIESELARLEKVDVDETISDRSIEALNHLFAKLLIR